MDRQVPEVRWGRDTPKAGDPVLSRAEVPTPIPDSPGGAVGPGPHTEAENLLPEGSSPQCQVGHLSPSRAHPLWARVTDLLSFQSEGTCVALRPGGSLDTLGRGRRVRPQSETAATCRQVTSQQDWSPGHMACVTAQLAGGLRQFSLLRAYSLKMWVRESNLRRIRASPCSLAGQGTLSPPARRKVGLGSSLSALAHPPFPKKVPPSGRHSELGWVA